MTTRQFEIDSAHSDIRFSVRHLGFSRVHGGFLHWKGSILFDEAAPTATRVVVDIDAKSIDTREPKRDGHLRSADFLDVERYPILRFESVRVEPREPRHYLLIGELTLHGVTRPVDLEVELLGGTRDPWGHDRLSFSAKTSLNRRDFGLRWNQVLESGGLLVGDTVDIAVEVEAVAAAAGQAA